jgi:hydrogenase maturation protease
MRRIVIAGIGNVLLGDDGLGPYAIEQLASRYDFGPEVELVDAGTPALDFGLYFADADLLIVVDAVKSTAPAGMPLSYSREEILRHSAPLRVDAHSPALGHALMFGDFAGGSPREVLLMGLAIGNNDPGTQLTGAVRASLPALLESIVETVRARGVSVTRPREPRPTHIWWEKAA